jgi:hypothetical protein
LLLTLKFLPGIELVAESSAVVSQNKGMVTATGIRLAYEPAAQKMETEAEEEKTPETNKTELNDLMAQLKSL